MKKGLIIFALALVGAFLFREGQREGIANLATSTLKATGKQSDKISNLDTLTSASASVDAEPHPVVSPSAAHATAPAVVEPQMQQRELPDLEHRPAATSSVRPDAGSLRANFLFRSTPWKVWTGVRAIPSGAYDDDERDILTQTNGYVIVKDDAMSGDDRTFQVTHPMVVFNERMGIVGVISGRVMLTLKDNATLPKMQREYGLKITDRFEHINLYFVTAATQVFDLGKFVNVLKRDPRVAKVELEILSRNYVKN